MREGGREGRREGGKEGRREGGKEGGRGKGGREGPGIREGAEHERCVGVFEGRAVALELLRVREHTNWA